MSIIDDKINILKTLISFEDFVYRFNQEQKNHFIECIKRGGSSTALLGHTEISIRNFILYDLKLPLVFYDGAFPTVVGAGMEIPPEIESGLSSDHRGLLKALILNGMEWEKGLGGYTLTTQHPNSLPVPAAVPNPGPETRSSNNAGALNPHHLMPAPRPDQRTGVMGPRSKNPSM